jgi:membrane protease YdiL (CAAX protease family)
MTAGVAARTPVRTWPAWAWFLAGFAVLYGVLAGTGSADRTGRWGLLSLAVVLASAVAVERVLVGVPLLEAPRRLGLGNPGWRAPVLALGISALVLLVHPLSAAVTGEPVALRPGWPWLLIGTFAFHGVAEEVVWRGHAFRRLREGRSFLGAVLVAAVTALPLSHLYEGGRNTVWAPAIVHTSIDSFTLVVLLALAVPRQLLQQPHRSCPDAEVPRDGR